MQLAVAVIAVVVAEHVESMAITGCKNQKKVRVQVRVRVQVHGSRSRRAWQRGGWGCEHVRAPRQQPQGNGTVIVAGQGRPDRRVRNIQFCTEALNKI
ncbi:hypothetical protein F4861DRAFT_518183, partial [Xylaria intraflava]